MTEIYFGGDIFAPADEKMLGPKGYRLQQLGYWSLQSDAFSVPRFAIASNSIAIDYYDQRGSPPQVEYGPLANANDIPDSHWDFFAELYDENSGVFDQCANYLASPNAIYIGSSIALQDNARLSLAGVNSRTTPTSEFRDSHFRRYAVAKALAGLYRPYSELYLRRHELAAPQRDASVMFYEYIDAEFEGVAHVIQGQVVVECKPLRSNAGHIPPVVRFSLDDTQTWTDYWSVDRRGDRLQRAVIELLQLSKNDESDLVEVEFCFTDDGDLSLLQYRPYSLRRVEAKAEDQAVPILSSVGETSGRLISLIGAPVSYASVDILREAHLAEPYSPPIWAVNKHSQGWDGFRLSWALNWLDINEPILVVMGREQDSSPTHLTSVLREDPGVGFFGEAEYSEIGLWATAAPITLRGDGYRTTRVTP